MKPSDKLEIISNLRKQGQADITQRLLAPMVSEVVSYANMEGLVPSEEPPDDAVDMFVPTENKKFIAVLRNGRQVEVSPQTFQQKAAYNFLPARYRTMVL